MTYDDRRDVFNIRLTTELEMTGQYEFPVVKPNLEIQNIENIISFNYYNQVSNRSKYYIHFYIDDYQFERIWTNPIRYINILKQFKGVIGPDFSVYKNMPKAQQIFQVYKQRLFMALLQKEGVNVIPNVTWSDDVSPNWILEDFPKHSVIALSSNGCLNKEVKKDFIKCYTRMVKMIEPIQIIFIGSVPDEISSDSRIFPIKSRVDYLHNLKKRSNI